MNFSVLLLLLFLFKISYIQAATECYTCSTSTKPECETLSDVSNIDKRKSTSGEDVNCLMYKYKLNGRVITYRDLRVKTDTCDDIKEALKAEKKELIECRLCDTDLCTNSNSGNYIKPANFIVIMFIVIKLIY